MTTADNYPRLVDATSFVLGMLAKIKDPRERATAILAVKAEAVTQAARFDALLGTTILELRSGDNPPTFDAIGDLLKMSRARAWQLFNEATKQQAEGNQ